MYTKKLVIFVLRATLEAFIVECLCSVSQKFFSYFDFHFGVDLLKINIAVVFCVITHCDSNRIMS